MVNSNMVDNNKKRRHSVMAKKMRRIGASSADATAWIIDVISTANNRSEYVYSHPSLPGRTFHGAESATVEFSKASRASPASSPPALENACTDESLRAVGCVDEVMTLLLNGSTDCVTSIYVGFRGSKGGEFDVGVFSRFKRLRYLGIENMSLNDNIVRLVVKDPPSVVGCNPELNELEIVWPENTLDTVVLKTLVNENIESICVDSKRSRFGDSLDNCRSLKKFVAFDMADDPEQLLSRMTTSMLRDVGIYTGPIVSGAALMKLFEKQKEHLDYIAVPIDDEGIESLQWNVSNFERGMGIRLDCIGIKTKAAAELLAAIDAEEEHVCFDLSDVPREFVHLFNACSLE